MEAGGTYRIFQPEKTVKTGITAIGTKRDRSPKS
jgi:hypothetical protein